MLTAIFFMQPAIHITYLPLLKMNQESFVRREMHPFGEQGASIWTT
jgi:hypothetical protein